jgi:acyl-coenzyme A synthetase/AMP-(fatty) acid ligase
MARELQQLVKSRLSPYKYPRRVHFVDALPRDTVGKVRAGVVKSWVTDGVPTAAASPEQPPSRTASGGHP